jgi:predicted DNA-binding protein YlxM (UPF0122 family)
MRVDEPIKILCVKMDLTLSQIAKRLNKTPQAFSQKIKRGTLTINDLDEIALVTDCKIECNFILPNGEKIQIQ